MLSKMDGNEKLVFILPDRLPTVYDVALSIYSIVSKPKSERMKYCIQAYVTALIDVWVKSFGNEHLIHRKYVNKKVETIVKEPNTTHRSLILITNYNRKERELNNYIQ